MRNLRVFYNISGFLIPYLFFLYIKSLCNVFQVSLFSQHHLDWFRITPHIFFLDSSIITSCPIQTIFFHIVLVRFSKMQSDDVILLKLSFWASIIVFKINSQTAICSLFSHISPFHLRKPHSCWNIFTCSNVPCHFLYMENLHSYSLPTNPFYFLTSLKTGSLHCSSTPSHDLDLVPLNEYFIYLHRIMCLLLCSNIDEVLYFFSISRN